VSCSGLPYEKPSDCPVAGADPGLNVHADSRRFDALSPCGKRVEFRV